MKQLLEYIPLLLFFSVWAMDERAISMFGLSVPVGGVFNAATFLLVASICVYGGLFLLEGKLDKFQWITFIGVLFACTLTIVFQSVTFLKWKAPVVNWIFAVVFLASRSFSDKPAIEHMMGHTVNAPKSFWYKLNNIWVVYFIALGSINLAVAYTLSESSWLQFKVFGNLIITFIFIIGQMPMLAKYIEDPGDNKKPEKESA